MKKSHGLLQILKMSLCFVHATAESVNCSDLKNLKNTFAI